MYKCTLYTIIMCADGVPVYMCPYILLVTCAATGRMHIYVDTSKLRINIILFMYLVSLQL